MNLSEELETHCDDEGDCEGVDLNRSVNLQTQLSPNINHSRPSEVFKLLFCSGTSLQAGDLATAGPLPRPISPGNPSIKEAKVNSVVEKNKSQYFSKPALSEPETQALHKQVTKVGFPGFSAS